MDKKNKQIDITPFIAFAVAIGGNNVRKEIDKIYKENKYTFYRYAKESVFYDNTALTGGDIITEEYARKTLGILLYLFKNQDRSLLEKVIKAIRKNKMYRLADNYVSKNGWQFKPFAAALTKKTNGAFLNKIDTDLFNSVCVLGIFLSNAYGKKVVKNEGFQAFIEMLHGLETIYTTPNPVLEEKIKGNKIKTAIFEGKSARYADQVWEILNVKRGLNDLPGAASVGVLFNLNKLEISCLERSTALSGKDIDSIIKSFEYFKQAAATEKDTDTLILLYYIVILIKAYNIVKEEFFKNNKETMFAEVEAIKKEKNSLLIEKNRVEEENKHLKSELQNIKNQTYIIQKLERNIEKLKKNLEEERAIKTELNALREFVFSLKSEQVQEKEENIIPIIRKKGIFVGGYDSLFAKLKQYLPKFSFVSGELNKFDESLLDNAGVVVVYPEVISHALYYFTVDEAKKRGIPVVFVKGTNVSSMMKAIYKKIL